MRILKYSVFLIVALLHATIWGQSWSELLSKSDSLSRAGDLEKAISTGQSALMAAEMETSNSDSAMAAVCHHLALLHHDSGDSAAFGIILNRWLDIEQTRAERETKDVGLFLLDLGFANYNQGGFAVGEACVLRAISYLERTVGRKDAKYGAALNELSIVYWYMGRLAEAEKLARQALEIYVPVFGTENQQVAKAKNNLGLILVNQGRYSEAELLHREALDVFQQVAPENSRAILSIMNNLAITYARQEKHQESIELNQEVLDLKEQVYGPEHSKLSPTLVNLAEVYLQIGEYDKAEPLFRRQLAIKEKLHGTVHPSLVWGLHGLARVYRERNEYDSALYLYDRVFNLDTLFFGKNHQLYANHLEYYGTLRALKGTRDLAMRSFRSAFDIRQLNLRTNGLALTERDALDYSMEMRLTADLCLSVMLDEPALSEKVMKDAGEIILATKGAVSENMFFRRLFQVPAEDSTVQGIVDEYQSVRDELASLYVKGNTGDDASAYTITLDSLANLADSIEGLLARHNSSFDRVRDMQEITTDRISSLLPERAVLVEYMRFTRHSISLGVDQDRYLVALYGHAGVDIVYDVGSADLIDSLVIGYRRHMQDMANHWPEITTDMLDTADSIQGALYDLIWKPVSARIAGRALVFVSPDGALNLVSFGGLRGSDGTYLIERFPIHYLTAGRDLIRLHQDWQPGKGLLALGDPDFDATPGERLASMHPHAATQAGGWSPSVRRGLTDDCNPFERIAAQPIPYTRREIEKVSESYKDKTKNESLVLIGAAANERNLKQFSPGYRLLHLATHGFFTLDSCQGKVAATDNVAADISIGSPLLKSGLLLAGANYRELDGDSTTSEDGVLTAYEVAGMNLHGTQWAVLSACGSGLGEVRAGEGVYGLNRAFQMAGVRTVICALWSIPDKETSRILTRLYTSDSDNLASSMRDLAVREIERLRARGLPDHPFTWGAFVAYGDWRLVN